jgi:hypothetical protein
MTVTKEDLQNFKGEIVHQFHIVAEGLTDQIKLLAEGHTGIIERLNKVDEQLDRIEKENERQHLETRAQYSQKEKDLMSVSARLSLKIGP